MKGVRDMLWPRLAKRLVSKPLTDARPAPPEEVVQALAHRLEATARARLGRSLAIREVDAGSCNGCELEVNAMAGVLYDMERFGLRIVASPKHADVLLVTGPVTRNMREALERTRACTPDPCWIVAAGDCAADGGVFKGSYAVESGVANVLSVDLVIPGCPPGPMQLLEGLLSLLEAQVPPKRAVAGAAASAHPDQPP
jgi:Ni,Fe-hydrogenase III small subunit